MLARFILWLMQPVIEIILRELRSQSVVQVPEGLTKEEVEALLVAHLRQFRASLPLPPSPPDFPWAAEFEAVKAEVRGLIPAPDVPAAPVVPVAVPCDCGHTHHQYVTNLLTQRRVCYSCYSEALLTPRGV
jgi:hypothetical protein